MDPENEGNLAALLREAMTSVTVTHSRFGTIQLSEYRQMVSRYRSRYEPTQRTYVQLFDLQIRDAKIVEAILALLSNELGSL